MLFKARSGVIFAGGLVVTVLVLTWQEWIAAGIIGVITVLAAIGVYLKVDRPVVRAIPTNS